MIHGSSVIEPGSRIGVFGGGQLGRMFAHAAQRFGYRVVIYSPEVDSPASQVASESILGEYLDLEKVRTFARSVDVITLEFENIELAAVEEAVRWCPVRPGPEVLSVAQHRIREKSTLAALGFPVTPFVAMEESPSQEELANIGSQLDWPMIIKTATLGYDGKGQRKVSNLSDAKQAIAVLGSGPLIAEKMIDFQCEVSLMVARNPGGEVATYPLFLNDHANHILDVTQCPCPASLAQAEKRATEIAIGVVEGLKLEGLLCIEFFVDQQGDVMINEMAPRPHNSGHLTIEACRTSQFEQQVRAVCNLPLGDTGLTQPAAMANLLGDVWQNGFPKFSRAMETPGTYLHLYGKSEAKPGRKMGHITQLAATSAEAAEQVRRLRTSLQT